MNLSYEAIIKDQDTDEVLARVSALSLEGLEEEIGKPKFRDIGKQASEKERSGARAILEDLGNRFGGPVITDKTNVFIEEASIDELYEDWKKTEDNELKEILKKQIFDRYNNHGCMFSKCEVCKICYEIEKDDLLESWEGSEQPIFQVENLKNKYHQ